MGTHQLNHLVSGSWLTPMGVRLCPSWNWDLIRVTLRYFLSETVPAAVRKTPGRVVYLTRVFSRPRRKLCTAPASTYIIAPIYTTFPYLSSFPGGQAKRVRRFTGSRKPIRFRCKEIRILLEERQLRGFFRNCMKKYSVLWSLHHQCIKVTAFYYNSCILLFFNNKICYLRNFQRLQIKLHCLVQKYTKKIDTAHTMPECYKLTRQ